MRRRRLVIWESSGVPGRRADPGPRPRAGGSRRCAAAARLLAVLAVLHLTRAVRPRWRPLLAGAALTAAGLTVRGAIGCLLFVSGVLLLVAALAAADEPEPDRLRHAELERELAAYSTQAERSDLQATLNRYPDAVAGELHEILARQAVADAGRRACRPAGFRPG